MSRFGGAHMPMKKCLLLAMILLLAAGLMGCAGGRKYRVTVADDYPLETKLEESYRAGREVTVKLPTVTEHYYRLLVNGETVEKREDSNMEYTYFAFSMPESDVVIEIEDHWVAIPTE